MEAEAFDKLISDKPPAIKVKGVTLFNALTQTLTAYRGEPTTSRLKDWQSAEAALNEFVAAMGESSASFTNIAQVLDYLKETGWKVTKTSLYRHQQEAKFVPRDGLFRKTDIDRYAKTWLKQRATGKKLNEAADDLQRQKLERELRRLDVEIKQRELSYDRDAGRLIPREQMEIELAGRAAILDAGLKHWIHSQAMEWVRLMAGDVRRVPELIHVMTRSIDDHINNYAQRQDYRIVIEEGEDPGDAEEEEAPC